MKKQSKAPNPRGTVDNGIPVWCHFDELRHPNSLAEFPGNPHTHPLAQLRRIAEIIRANGWREAITISRQSGRITKGHGRKAAAVKAKWKSVPVVIQDYENEEAERRDVIADNRARDGAEIDDEALVKMLAGVGEKKGTGFSAEEIDALSRDAAALSDAPAPPDSVAENLREMELIRQRRLRTNGNEDIARKNDTEKYLVIVFPDRAKREKACKALGLPADERYVPASVVRMERIAGTKYGGSADRAAKRNKAGACG